MKTDKSRHGYLVEDKDGFAHNSLTLNLAINLFDKLKYDRSQLSAAADPESYYFNPQTLSFLLASQQAIPQQHATIFFKGLFFGALPRKQDPVILNSRNSKRTILINNNNISAIDFDNDPDQKNLQIQTGIQNVGNFFHPQANTIQQPSPRISDNPALASSPLHKKPTNKKTLKQSDETWNNSDQYKRSCIIL